MKGLGEHPWAGEYFRIGPVEDFATLLIAPTNGYIFQQDTCTGLYSRNYGRVQSDDGGLRLTFEIPDAPGLQPELVVVPWDPRTYLIPPDQLIAFCQTVNEGIDSRDRSAGWFFVRRGTERKRAEGLPAVPPELEKYLLKEPILSEIVAVGPTSVQTDQHGYSARSTPVTINGGKDAGCFVGMRMSVMAPAEVLDGVTITSVGDESCEGLFTTRGNLKDVKPNPQVGWTLSSRYSEARLKMIAYP